MPLYALILFRVLRRVPLLGADPLLRLLCDRRLGFSSLEELLLDATLESSPTDLVSKCPKG